MNVELSWDELRKWLRLGGKETEPETEKRGVELFGGGVHIHFHISINPTFPMKPKEGI